MPSVDCDPATARTRLENAGIDIQPGNTEYERWRATHEAGNVVAYEDSVVVQGRNPATLLALIRESSGGRVHVYFDGASRGNPGPAAIGWVLVNSSGIVTEGGDTIKSTTNNRAEYAALTRGLEVATAHSFEKVDIRGDSELIIKQVRGEYQTNQPALRERRIEVRQLLESFDDYTLEHVPREANSRADKLANKALDAAG